MQIYLKKVKKFMNKIKQFIKLMFLKIKFLNKNVRIGKNTFISRKCNIILGKNSILEIGDNVYISDSVRIIVHDNAKLIINKGVYISWNSLISSNSEVIIGNNTLIAHFVTIIDTNKRFNDINTIIRKQGSETRPIYIGEDCWITTGVVILGGTILTKHNIIAANSVVNKKFEENCLIGGIPGKVIKEL